MVSVPENNELLEAAYSYAERGWEVLPLHSISSSGGCTCGATDCSSPGKHPRNSRGSSAASSDRDQIKDWWYLWPEANVGVSTGIKSNLLVVDADGEEGLSSLTNTEKFPPSLSVVTGSGGVHLYYQYQEGVKNSAKKVAPGIDIRGDGGYVVAPPSLHSSGERYRFANEDRLVPYPVVPGPQEALQEPTAVSGLIPTGQRNSVLMSIGGSLRRRGLDEEEIYVALQAVNRNRCNPGLRDTEIRAISRSVLRYRPEDPISFHQSRIPRIQVQTALELCSIALPDQDELVGPLLVRGNRLVIAGHTGEGKTTFALQLLRSYLNGDNFLKWESRSSDVLARALVIDAEQGLRTIQRRLSESNLSSSTTLDYVRVPDGLNLDSITESEQIEQVIAEKEYGVIVLDPLYKLHKGELTDERVAVELMRKLDAWRERYHFALILLAHCRKPPMGAPFTIHDVFGSTAVSRGAEIILGLQRTGTGTSRLHFFKDRDGDLDVGESWELTFDPTGSGFESPMQRLWQDEKRQQSLPENVVEIDEWR